MKKILQKILIITLVLTLIPMTNINNVTVKAEAITLKNPVDSGEYKFPFGISGEHIDNMDFYEQCPDGLTDDEVIKNQQNLFIRLSGGLDLEELKNGTKIDKITYNLIYNLDKTIKNRHYYAEFIRHFGYYRLGIGDADYLNCYNHNYYMDIIAPNMTERERYNYYWDQRKKMETVPEETFNSYHFRIAGKEQTPSNVKATFKDGTLALNWKYNWSRTYFRTYKWGSYEYYGFAVIISTKKDFSKKKTYFLSIRDDIKRWGDDNAKITKTDFSYTIKNLNKYRDYYYKIVLCQDVYSEFVEKYVPKEKDYPGFKGTDAEGNKPHFLSSYRPKRYLYGEKPYIGVIKNKSFTLKSGKSKTYVTDLETGKEITLKRSAIKKLLRNKKALKTVTIKLKGATKMKSYATGYQIQISNNRKSLRNGKKLLTNRIVNINNKKLKKSKLDINNKKFTKQKKLYARVRSYVTINGKRAYGKWSKIKKVKIK